MGACVGKYSRTDNESNRSSRKHKFRFSTALKREEQQTPLIQTEERNETSSSTSLYDLPLEILDIVLQKSYLHWILNSPTEQKDEEVIRALTSVDVCFYRRITRQRFKKAIWRYLKDIYGKIKKRSAIINNNGKYLLQNIQPNDELIELLLSLNCITEEQSQCIQRQHSNREKNDELLYVMRSLDETKFSNVLKCLRQTNQKTVARIIENGGGVMQIKVQTRGAKCRTSMETQLLHEQIENRTKPRSHQTDKIISQLREEDIEILNSQLDRKTLVVWIWCRSQAALEHIQKLYESNQLRDVFFENIQPCISMVINIDGNQFKKTVVVCPLSIKFTRKLKLQRIENVYGVTKLRNNIYVLCRIYLNKYFVSLIRVNQDRESFRVMQEIEIGEFMFPVDIGSSEKENCLYVSDADAFCVWKITRDTGDQHKVIKWLTTYFKPDTLSVSSEGQLLMVNDFSFTLNIYGSDAELLRCIRLPKDIKDPRHAVETSMGNVIIIHSWIVREVEGKSGSSWSEGVTMCGICESSRDGQIVIRRFSPSHETQKLVDPCYLSLDSDDRVFVADRWDGRVILLDSDLKWNRILCPAREKKEETKRVLPVRVCYDEEKKQLIVGDHVGVKVYTLSRN